MADEAVVAKLRVDQVGSLLRPKKLKDVYARHGLGAVSDGNLREAQDEAIHALIVQQEAHRLPVLTDGEYRRLNFQDSFVESVSGFVSEKQTLQFQESRTLGGQALQRWQPDSAITDPKLQYWRPITRRLRLNENQPLKEWRFAAKLTMKPVKVTLLSPDRVCENFERQNSSRSICRFGGIPRRRRLHLPAPRHPVGRCGLSLHTDRRAELYVLRRRAVSGKDAARRGWTRWRKWNAP